MITYVYKCECGKTFEHRFSIKEDSSECMCECGKTAKKDIGLSLSDNKEKAMFFPIHRGFIRMGQRFK